MRVVNATWSREEALHARRLEVTIEFDNTEVVALSREVGELVMDLMLSPLTSDKLFALATLLYEQERPGEIEAVRAEDEEDEVPAFLDDDEDCIVNRPDGTSRMLLRTVGGPDRWVDVPDVPDLVATVQWTAPVDERTAGQLPPVTSSEEARRVIEETPPAADSPAARRIEESLRGLDYSAERRILWSTMYGGSIEGRDAGRIRNFAVDA